ncbi:Acyl-CoA N-acyltransferase with RING/FYVE/PHD-type zinc finger domain-containing protein [Perilla frutescens var. hirtella]|nr:Acyl-CoA N-acyltransferase with RING/FYVE/PHD-type zinc finger domain-containing protein [Perilla frutescens var. hirtella]
MSRNQYGQEFKEKEAEIRKLKKNMQKIDEDKARSLFLPHPHSSITPPESPEYSKYFGMISSIPLEICKNAKKKTIHKVDVPDDDVDETQPADTLMPYTEPEPLSVDSDPEAGDDPYVSHPEDDHFPKQSSGPWFSFDDIRVHKRREKMHTFAAWIDNQLNKDGAELRILNATTPGEALGEIHCQFIESSEDEASAEKAVPILMMKPYPALHSNMVLEEGISLPHLDVQILQSKFDRPIKVVTYVPASYNLADECRQYRRIARLHLPQENNKLECGSAILSRPKGQIIYGGLSLSPRCFSEDPSDYIIEEKIDDCHKLILEAMDGLSSKYPASISVTIYSYFFGALFMVVTVCFVLWMYHLMAPIAVIVNSLCLFGSQDFSAAKFDDRTMIICDLEYHVGCLRESKMCDIKKLENFSSFITSAPKNIMDTPEKFEETTKELRKLCAESHAEFQHPAPLWKNEAFFVQLPFKKNKDINSTKATHPGMNPEELALAKQECSQLLSLGLIEPTKSNWACRAFYVNNRAEQIRGKKRLNMLPYSISFWNWSKIMESCYLKRKGIIGKDSITFLGMKISEGQYEPGPHITEELQKFPTEKLTVKEIQQFLGIVNYIKDFIPNCSRYTSKLSKLLKKNAPEIRKLKKEMQKIDEDKARSLFLPHPHSSITPPESPEYSKYFGMISSIPLEIPKKAKKKTIHKVDVPDEDDETQPADTLMVFPNHSIFHYASNLSDTSSNIEGDEGITDVSKILMADPESQPYTEPEPLLVDSDPEAGDDPYVSHHEDDCFPKQSSGPWFSFDDIPIHKRREKMHTFAAWWTINLTKMVQIFGLF